MKRILTFLLALMLLCPAALAENGLTVAVMGTALFRNKNMKECIQRLHRIGLNN